MTEARELLVQLRGHPTDGRRRDIAVTHRFQDRSDVARADALEVHLRTRHQQRPFASLPPGEHARMVRLARPHLRDVQLQQPNPRIQRPRLDAVAIARPRVRPLVTIRSDVLGCFRLHRLVEQVLQQPLGSVWIRKDFLQQLPENITICLGHRFCLLDQKFNNLLIETNGGLPLRYLQMVCYTATASSPPPSPSSSIPFIPFIPANAVLPVPAR